MYISLDKLKAGQECKIISIDIIDKAKKRHLLDMGVTRGTTIKIKRIAPMGDPVSLELRGYVLNVSKDDLKRVLVEVKNENSFNRKSK